jgi:1-acyl-sn-glycerol-3-phosphate acyltransferase
MPHGSPETHPPNGRERAGHGGSGGAYASAAMEEPKSPKDVDERAPTRGPTRPERDVWWYMARGGVGGVFRAAFRIRFFGLLHIPTEGGALIATNHVSVLDPVIVALGGARRGRPIRFLALSELFESGVLGWALRTSRQIPLRRGTGDWDAIRAVAEAVSSGSLVGMSPEGRVTDGVEELPGQKGAGRIALSAHCPIIPSGIWGTNRRWPKDGPTYGAPLRPPVALVFGAPIVPEGDPRNPRDVRALTERLMEDVRGLAAAARSRVTDGH